MALASILTLVALVVGAALVATSALCIGVQPFRTALGELRARLYEIAPYAGAVTAVYVLNKLAYGFTVQLSWSIGLPLTGTIYDIEGQFVALLQDAVPGPLFHYFAFVYLFGFAFVLAFPVVAYFVLPSLRQLKVLLLAYAANYAGGMLCYTLVIAYGPRNLLPATVDHSLFELYPQAMVLTSAVSSNTNVFPSLHTSLAATAMLLAWYTRDEYPRWFAVATVLGTSIILSTMVLGIHWLIDVVAGLALAIVSVLGARRAVAVVDALTGRDRGRESDNRRAPVRGDGRGYDGERTEDRRP